MSLSTSGAPQPGTQVSVVVVTYNSTDTIGQAVTGLPAAVEVILVDQDSSDDTVAAAMAARSDLIVIHAGTNRGFGAGCNLGAANASGEVIVFLNPDASIDPASLGTLVEAVKAHRGTLVGPRLLDSDGSDATRARRWSAPARDSVDLLLTRRVIPAWLQRDLPSSDPVYRTGGSVPYIQGACMAISAAVFKRIGGFDERYFLYAEEEILARALQGEGLAARLEPRATAVHIGHTSTDGTGLFSVGEMYRSRARLYVDRYGWIGGTAGCLLTAATLALLLVTAKPRKRIGYRKTETAAWCRAALKGTGNGWLARPTVPPK